MNTLTDADWSRELARARATENEVARQIREQLGKDVYCSRKASFEITYDGEVVVNRGWVEASGKRVVALAFDLKTKRAEIIATFSGGDEPSLPGVVLSGEHALHINKARKGEPTHIVFPEYRGWMVHCSEVARYTMRVCLVKPNTPATYVPRSV